MKVLIDYAHADLWESLILLFEDRFGWEVYRPIGFDWYTRGIWRFEYQNPAVAHQFLDRWATDQEDDRIGYDWGVLLRDDDTHPSRKTKMVTYDVARSRSWDLVIATLAENEEGLCGFAREVGAHYGIQIGNQGAPNQWGMAEFGLCSTTLPFTPFKPHVFYHQEFNLQDFRFEWPPAHVSEVQTRVQCFTGTEYYERFRRLAGLLPELTFRHYGHCGDRDEFFGGDHATTPAVAQSMRDAGIGYHDKRWSDGYGHVIHNWAAVGRPIFVSKDYYADKLAAPLFGPIGVGIFNLQAMSDAEVVAEMRHLTSDPEYHHDLSAAVAARFRAVVSFEQEAADIKQMLEGVLSDRLVRA